MSNKRSKTVVEKYYNASLALYTAIKSNKYVKFESISREYKINSSFFKMLVRLGVVDKVRNGVYVWKREDEAWQPCPLDRETINDVLDGILEYNKSLTEKKVEAEPVCEKEEDIENKPPSEDGWVFERSYEESMINTSPVQQITESPSNVEHLCFNTMLTLIENNSVILEKAPSTAVDIVYKMLDEVANRKNNGKV
jgi:hypothetical protein